MARSKIFETGPPMTYNIKPIKAHKQRTYSPFSIRPAHGPLNNYKLTSKYQTKTI